MLKRILVPLDGSWRAEHALPVAARIARYWSGSVLLLRVVMPPVDSRNSLAPVPLDMGAIMEQMTQATSYLKAVARAQGLAGIETTTEVLFGSPAEQILGLAESQAADLLVMSSHGRRTGIARWILGSVAHRLTHQSTVPVLVLREDEPSPALSGANAMRPLSALVLLDSSPLAEAVLVPAASLVTTLSAPAQGMLHLVQVVKPLSSASAEGLVSELNEEAVQHANAYLTNVKEHMQTTMKDLKLSITCSVVPGTDVAETLLGLLEQQGEGKRTEGPGGSTLIAISTHGRGGLKRWVMGSVIERLLDTTTLPMLIVRPRIRQAKHEGGA